MKEKIITITITAALTIATEKPQLFAQAEPFLKKLAWASDVTVTEKMPENADSMVSCATDIAHVFMPMSDLVDAEKEKARISAEIDKAKKFVASLEAKLSNESFVKKAPAAIVEAEKQKLEKNKALIAKLEDSLRLL